MQITLYTNRGGGDGGGARGGETSGGGVGGEGGGVGEGGGGGRGGVGGGGFFLFYRGRAGGARLITDSVYQDKPGYRSLCVKPSPLRVGDLYGRVYHVVCQASHYLEEGG